MSRRLLAAAAAALILGSAQALAGTADVGFSDFRVSVYDATGAPNPLSTVVFVGDDTADTRITSVPDDPFPGPPGWTGYAQGLVDGPGAFGSVLSLGEIDDVVTFEMVAWFRGLADAAPGGQVSASGGDVFFGGGFSTSATLKLGGTSFTLAPHSELVVSTSLGMSASGGYAGASLAFAGPQGSSWSHAEGNGSFSDDVSLVFRNDSDAAVTDAFSATFTASSVPEPAPAALLMLGTAALLLQRRCAPGSPGRRARVQKA